MRRPDSSTIKRSRRGATTLLNLSYDYANAGGKRTGQLTKILNNLNHNKDRGYSYDALDANLYLRSLRQSHQRECERLLGKEWERERRARIDGA
jgi:hypothetical protein